MYRELLPFPVKSVKPSRPAALSSLRLLRELCEQLVIADQFVSEVHQKAPRGDVPNYFSFHDSRDNSRQRFVDGLVAVEVARRNPELGAAWASLPGLIEEAFTLAAEQVEVRHMARAVPRLRQRLAKLGNCHEHCRQFSNLLDLVDDEIISVSLPAERTGWRILVRGLANLGQLHVMLADRINPLKISGDTATIRWQFFSPVGLQAHNTLPQGLHGHEHWLWESQHLREIALVNGKRQLLAGPPTYPRQWIVKNPFAAVTGELYLLETISDDSLRKAA